MKKIILVFYLFSTLLCAEELPHLNLTGGFDPPENELVNLTIQEAAKRSGLSITVHSLPNKRSLIQANNGLFEGEASRIWGINKYYPNLSPVPGAVHSIDLIALTNNKDIVINQPSDMSRYNVGVIHGMKIAVLLAEKVNPVSVYKAPNHETLINMLKANRLDLIITNKFGLLSSLDVLQGSNLNLIKKPLLSMPLYVQLHKGSLLYLPQLQAALESMHKDGSYEKIRQDFLYSYEKRLSYIINTLPMDE